MARKAKMTRRAVPDPEVVVEVDLADDPTPEQYVVWMNLGKALEEVKFDEEHIVKDWVPLREVSVPERFTDKCESLGLKRIRNAGP